jgi:hypothetical protein
MIFEEDIFDIKDIDKDGKMFEKGLFSINRCCITFCYYHCNIINI